MIQLHIYVHECILGHFIHVRLCNSVDCNPPGSSVHRILQARILEWVAIPLSRGSSWPRDLTCISYVSCIGRQVLFITSTTWEACIYICVYIYIYTHIYIYMYSESEVAQSCPTLCDSMDCSLPGSSIHGILQARVLEWVAISFSIYMYIHVYIYIVFFRFFSHVGYYNILSIVLCSVQQVLIYYLF